MAIECMIMKDFNGHMEHSVDSFKEVYGWDQ